MLDDHPGIREDIVRVALAGHAAELLGQAAAEEQASPQLMALAEAAFASLDVAGEHDVGGRGWARAFELKLAHVLGVRPSLLRCASCGAPIESGPTAWSVNQGGVLVGDCRDLDPFAVVIGRAALQSLKAGLHRPLVEQAEVSWTPVAVREAQTALFQYLDEHVGRRSKARGFLDSILAGVAPFAALVLAALFAGCAASPPPEDVRVQGWLFDTETPAEDALAISGATLFAYADDGEVLDEGSEPFDTAPGFYRAAGLPVEAPVHMEFLAPPAEDDDGNPLPSEYLSTVRSGRTAADDLWVDDGVFLLRLRADLEQTIDDASDAFGLDGDARLQFPDAAVEDQGGLLEARLAEGEIVPGLRFRVVDSLGFTTEVLYRGADGRLEEGVGVDATGRFVAVGLLAGPASVDLLDGAGEPTGRTFRTRFVEDGVTLLYDFVP